MSSHSCIRAIIGVALLLLAAHPSHAGVSFVGGTASQQEALRAIHSHMPACCQAQCSVCVQLLDDGKMNSYLRAAEGARAAYINNSAVDGVYQDCIPTITLRTQSPDADVSATFAHEYGHYVWKRLLTSEQRAHFERVYKAQAAAHHLVSLYAAVSVEEGFAETFYFYTLRRPQLETCDPLSCDCLNKFVRGNKPNVSATANPSSSCSHG